MSVRKYLEAFRRKAEDNIFMRTQNKGQNAAEILQRMADRNALAAQISDPVKWQREIRQDRALPGRE